jgi:hypothetical protein
MLVHVSRDLGTSHHKHQYLKTSHRWRIYTLGWANSTPGGLFLSFRKLAVTSTHTVPVTHNGIPRVKAETVILGCNSQHQHPEVSILTYIHINGEKSPKDLLVCSLVFYSCASPLCLYADTPEHFIHFQFCISSSVRNKCWEESVKSGGGLNGRWGVREGNWCSGEQWLRTIGERISRKDSDACRPAVPSPHRSLDQSIK